MAQLQAVVFSLRNVFFNDADRNIDLQLIGRLIKLIKHLAKKGIKVILHSNDRWYMRRDRQITVADHLSQITGENISYYNTDDFPAMPRKPRAEAIPYILNNEGLAPNEIIYVGCNANDWRACINAKILFIKATWIKSDAEIPYGFSFDDMAALARFIDICCIQANQNDLINYKDEHIEYYTLSPFSTYKPQFEAYSASARSTAKKLTQDAEPDFWLMLLIAKIYFSGLYQEIQTIIAFPGHKIGFGNTVMDEALDVFAKCFRMSYLHNALVRHTQSIKSQTARNQGQSETLGIYNHLNTLMLNRNPIKFGTTKPLVGNPYKGKTILLIDDIATAGYSLDAASLLLKRANAKRVVCFSWLKTINTALQISRQPLPPAYPVFTAINDANRLYPAPNQVYINYQSIMSSAVIGYEMSKLFADFINWDEDI
ncbi:MULTISPECIES: hypothetical protein [Acinetobacter]|uniref:hypothetical protein n=1 Tax=Acinetobacter TaxID=469 RepID=UPI000CEC7C60|nr:MULTISPECIES: hypothetical protein [Acinetobacter]TMS47689.1 hypothetical protein FGQ54_09180 [Acinetobacter lwoffii]